MTLGSRTSRHEPTGQRKAAKELSRILGIDALEQAEDDADRKVPLVLDRRNCKPWIAITYLDQLPKLGDLRAEE